MANRSDIDWEACRRDYRLGILSIREVATKHGVSKSQLQVRAKSGGWERDLSSDVRAEAKAKVLRHTQAEAEQEFKKSVRESAQGAARADAARTVDAIEAGAEALATIELKQRGRLSRNALIAEKLADRLEEAVEQATSVSVLAQMAEDGDPETAKALRQLASLPALIDAHKKLTETNSKQQADERVAFGLNDKAEATDTAKEVTQAILAMSQ